MLDFKNIIANKLKEVTNIDTIEEYIEVPANKDMGDYSLPCFKLAKELKKVPQMIATEIKEKLEIDENIISRIEVVNGYLNFFVNNNKIAEVVLNEINEKKENYGSSTIGNGKNIVVEYSSPNIAKPFHIGHLRTTLIGNSLYRIYKYLGYNTIGINHLGDYGTQFGKMIEAYKMWGNEYDLSEEPINKMVDMYVRINELCKKDEQVLERCRENFRLLENGDKYCTDLWNKFKDLSLIEFNKIYDVLGVKFDSWNGEAFYADKMDEVIKKLEEKGVVTESEGAKVVDLTDVGISTPCIIQKANGSSIYATRDLAAVMYRAKTYDFDKCLYVVAYEQNLHFKQIFAVARYLVDEKYVEGLKHVAFGMVSLPSGKMSTRLGNVVKIEELLTETIEKAKEIIEEKNPKLDNKDEVAKKVGIGAIIFNTLSTSNIKDQIFDWSTALNFNGETGPYLQYMYVRTNSILEKVEKMPDIADVDISLIQDDASINLIKAIYNFGDTVKQVADKNEPYIISRYLINLAQLFSTFYTENKVITDDKKIQNARVYLTYCVNIVLKTGASLLGMQMPDKM